MGDLKHKVIGCGYCKFEKTCEKHDPKVNKAKAGCEQYKRYDNEK